MPVERRSNSLARVVTAVTEEAPAATVSAALYSAIEDGALLETRPGVYVPLQRRAPHNMPSEWNHWLGRGFIPFLCKLVPLTPLWLEILEVVYGTLRNVDGVSCVPHWLSGSTSFSLYLPNAMDLRQPLSSGRCNPACASAIHQVCLSSLESFTKVDQSLRHNLSLVGLHPEPFPIAERYHNSVRSLLSIAEDIGLPPALPSVGAGGPTALFWDPKPANFVVPMTSRPCTRLIDGHSPAKVDLDLMHYQCPISLQIVVALFAHPIARIASTLDASFDAPPNEGPCRRAPAWV